MTRLTLIILTFFVVLNVQGQKQRLGFSELLTDMECLSSIVKKGLQNQMWDLEQLTEHKDSCINYKSLREFNLSTDTLIITRIENNENSKFFETRLTIENDSVVIARFIPNEPIDISKGKTGKLLTKEETERQPGYITIRFIYDGLKMKVDFFSDLKTDQSD